MYAMYSCCRHPCVGRHAYSARHDAHIVPSRQSTSYINLVMYIRHKGAVSPCNDDGISQKHTTALVSIFSCRSFSPSHAPKRDFSAERECTRPGARWTFARNADNTGLPLGFAMYEKCTREVADSDSGKTATKVKHGGPRRHF